MRKRGGLLLSCISGGMEICWIYAWVSFSMVAILGHATSLPLMAAIFTFAAILTYLSMGRGWRVVTFIGMYILGYAVVALFVLHGLFYPSYPIAGTLWISLFFTDSRTPLEWVHLILAFIWVGLIWLGGGAFAKREKIYITTCTRFDIGLAAFFVLLLVKLALRVKGGIDADDHVSSALIYPFLLLSIIAIGMTRVGHEGSRHFLPGHGGFGIFMSFISVIILSASSLIFLLIPVLTQVAETGQRVLKNVAFWMLPVVSGAIGFMFMGGRIRPDPPSGSSPKGVQGSESLFAGSWWTELLEKIFRWGIEVIAVTFFTFAIALLIFLILKWLFSRTVINPRIAVNLDDSLPWLMRLRAFFAALWEALKNLFHGYIKAAELFSVLSEWARRSGLPRLITDTPFEFGSRLSHQFPSLKAEIETIVTALSIESYGEKRLTVEQFASALTAWRTLRNPVHWPQRLKTRLVNTMLPER
jgi:hypothetical protein